MKFLRHYALEFYSVIAMLLIVCAAIFMDELTVIQKFTIFLSFIYILLLLLSLCPFPLSVKYTAQPKQAGLIPRYYAARAYRFPVSRINNSN